MCVKLKKALYSLKQAPRVWYERIDGFLQILGFNKNSADPNLYFKVVENQPLIPVVALMHTCKRELSPAHLVCPRRHNV
jgi:hypothetical protein